MRSLHKQDSEPENPQVLIFNGNETEVRLPGLHPYSQYSLNIRAFNGKGDGPTSSDQQFETPEGGTDMCTFILYVLICQSMKYYCHLYEFKWNKLCEFLVPGPPTHLKVRNLNLDSLIVEWAPPVEDNGHLTGYLLKYQSSRSKLQHVLWESVADLGKETDCFYFSTFLFSLFPCSQYNRRTWSAQRGDSTSKQDQHHSGQPQVQHALQVLSECHDCQGLWPHHHRRGRHNHGRRWGLALWLILH